MKERMIFAPGLNGSELLRSMALHGMNTMNLRIMGSAELARYALMRSGIALTCGFPDAGEQTALLAGPVLAQPYFVHAGMADIQEVARALRTARMLVTEEAEEQVLTETLRRGVFAEKNEALCQVYQTYMQICREKNLLDPVALIRKAAFSCKPIPADFTILSEYPLTPLEKRLLETISGGSWTEQSLSDLYRTEPSTVCVKDYRVCYGAPNEVEMILDTIYRNHKLDSCVVAVSNPSVYAQLFLDYSLLYELPVTFGTGVPILNSNPAKLLKLYGIWCQEGFFGVDALTAMLTSDVFDTKKFRAAAKIPEDLSQRKLLELLGPLRLTNESSVNSRRLADYAEAADPKPETLAMLSAISAEFSLPVADFIWKYAHLRRGGASNAEKFLMKLDAAAASSVYSSLKILTESGLVSELKDMITTVLRMNICSESSREGFLHVTSIRSAFSALRKQLFVAGLSASVFPGSPKEHYLLLDEDLKLFRDSERLTSEGQILAKRDMLLNLVRLASSLSNGIAVSYPGLNVSELKKQNASSVLLDLFRLEHGPESLIQDLEKQLQVMDYFEPAISINREIGKAYNLGLEILPARAPVPETLPERILEPDARQDENLNKPNQRNRANEPEEPDGSDSFDEPEDSEEENIAMYLPHILDVSWKLETPWSPSALLQFFNCPRRFCLQYILGIPEPEETNPFQVISPAEEGTLAHSLMEKLANSTMSEEEFLDLSGQAFDTFLKQKPPLIRESVPVAKGQFLDMMTNAYELDPHKEVVLDEEDIHCTHESGVLIHGFPDRVEAEADGTYTIVDFKTGRHISHETDDPDTCLQVLIYAYLCEQHFGYRINHCEFRYFRLGEVVSCRYDDEMREALNQKLCQFRAFLEHGYFPACSLMEDASDTDPCKYCTYGAICMDRGENITEGGELE